MFNWFLFISISIPIIVCFPVKSDSKETNLNSIKTSGPQIESINEKPIESALKSRTLTPHTFGELWRAKGEMKVAFLKFCIFKLKIFIKLISNIYGLRPHNRQRYPEPNQYYSNNNQDFNRNRFEAKLNPIDVQMNAQQFNDMNNFNQDQYYHYDYNDIQFQLFPEDLTAKSRQIFKSILSSIWDILTKITNFFKF